MAQPMRYRLYIDFDQAEHLAQFVADLNAVRHADTQLAAYKVDTRDELTDARLLQRYIVRRQGSRPASRQLTV